MTEKMTIEKAREIVESEKTDVFNPIDIWCAKSFLEGWDARMEYEAERNGRPKGPTE